MYWFTADEHFGHVNIGRYESRPDGWEQLIVDRRNAYVRPGDVVYSLGDFSLTSLERGRATLSLLNGESRLVLGNHDGTAGRMSRMGFSEVYGSRKRSMYENTFYLPLTLASGVRVVLSHAPLVELPPGYSMNLHGHIHSNAYPFEKKRWHVNVGVDVTGFRPLSELEIVTFVTDSYG